MKGWRFYEEFETTKRKVSTGNVIALDIDPLTLAFTGYTCVSALYFEPNSPVASSSAFFCYIQHYCKRVSEARARKIHPKLFEYLERED